MKNLQNQQILSQVHEIAAFLFLEDYLRAGVFFLGNIVKGIETGAVVFLLWEVIKDFAAATIYFGVTKKNKKIS